MSLRVELLALGLLAACSAGQADTQSARAPLRVCADPNNLPFSNRREEGFENRLARLLAADLGQRVEYTWWPQRRGFARLTLNAGRCDVILGVPTSYERAWTTRPYYRSTYVFVTRGDRPAPAGLDDPALRRQRIGVHVIGDDYTNTPAAAALARRGIIDNVRGYSVYGDYSQPDPPLRLFDAVATGEIDVAIAWGPPAGYYARRLAERDGGGRALRLAPVTPQIDLPFLPFVFDISMAVRRGDSALHRALDGLIERRRTAIHELLAEYGVPTLAAPSATPGARRSR